MGPGHSRAPPSSLTPPRGTGAPPREARECPEGSDMKRHHHATGAPPRASPPQRARSPGTTMPPRHGPTTGPDPPVPRAMPPPRAGPLWATTGHHGTGMPPPRHRLRASGHHHARGMPGDPQKSAKLAPFTRSDPARDLGNHLTTWPRQWNVFKYHYGGSNDYFTSRGNIKLDRGE